MTMTQNSENLENVAMETWKSWIADFKGLSSPEIVRDCPVEVACVIYILKRNRHPLPSVLDWEQLKWKVLFPWTKEPLLQRAIVQ